MPSRAWRGEEPEMEQRRFGTSGLSVSVLSFGTMTIGGRDRFGKMGNFGAATIDTADVYTCPYASRLLG